MVVKEVYPHIDRQIRVYQTVRNIARYVFIAAALVCLIPNYLTGGKFWSAVVVWSIITAWNIFFSPDRFEFNAISQTVKVIFHAVVLLWLIIFSIALSIFLIIRAETEWPVIVLISVAAGLLCLSLFYHEEFILEIKKRFHTH